MYPSLFSRCKCLPEWQFRDSVPMTAKAHCGVLFILSWHRIFPLPGRTTHPSSWPSLMLPQRSRSYPITQQTWIKHFLCEPERHALHHHRHPVCQKGEEWKELCSQPAWVFLLWATPLGAGLEDHSRRPALSHSSLALPYSPVLVFSQRHIPSSPQWHFYMMSVLCLHHSCCFLGSWENMDCLMTQLPSKQSMLGVNNLQKLTSLPDIKWSVVVFKFQSDPRSEDMYCLEWEFADEHEGVTEKRYSR